MSREVREFIAALRDRRAHPYSNEADQYLEYCGESIELARSQLDRGLIRAAEIQLRESIGWHESALTALKKLSR